MCIQRTEIVTNSAIYFVGCIAVPSLQINIIPLLVTMNRKIKKPPVKLNFLWSQ